MLDIDGYLLSTEFLFQVGTLISAILSAIFGEWIASLFGGP